MSPLTASGLDLALGIAALIAGPASTRNALRFMRKAEPEPLA